MRSRSVTFAFLLAATLSTAFTSGCSSNRPNVAPTASAAPAQVTYNMPLDRVWAATQQVLAAEATFKILDKSSALMVTEYKTVDSQELSMMGTAFLGTTYKNNYTVTFTPSGQDKTNMKIAVGLQAQQVGFYTREADDPAVVGYLRQRLFDKVSASLR